MRYWKVLSMWMSNKLDENKTITTFVHPPTQTHLWNVIGQAMDGNGWLWMKFSVHE